MLAGSRECLAAPESGCCYHKGEMLSILCRFVLVFCLYGFRQACASGRGLQGGVDVEAKAALAGRRKITKKVVFKRESFSYPVPVPILGLGSLLKQTLTQSSGFVELEIFHSAFVFQAEEGRLLQKSFLTAVRNHLSSFAPFTRESDSHPLLRFLLYTPTPCLLCALGASLRSSSKSPRDLMCVLLGQKTSCQGQGLHGGWRVLFSGEGAMGPNMLRPYSL